jgi:hypothetical protein
MEQVPGDPVILKRRNSLSRGLFYLGTDPSPLAQDDKSYFSHKFSIQCLNGKIFALTEREPFSCATACSRGFVLSGHPDCSGHTF